MSTKKAESDRTLDEIHRVVINLYKEFRELCDKHSLRYFAISGTTIGAALWKGFIPWDDDMDIAMPAEDYLKLVKYAKNELPKHIGIESYLWFGSKIFNKNTTFTDIHYIDMPERYCGIFIDIVPLISLPDNNEELDAFMDDFRSFIRHAIMFDRYNVILRTSENMLYADTFEAIESTSENSFCVSMQDLGNTKESKLYVFKTFSPFEGWTSNYTTIKIYDKSMRYEYVCK